MTDAAVAGLSAGMGCIRQINQGAGGGGPLKGPQEGVVSQIITSGSFFTECNINFDIKIKIFLFYLSFFKFK